MAHSIVADAALRTESAGRVLLGGHPFRVLRLSDGGARKVRSWFAGDARPESDEEIALAGRLIAANLAHPQPEPTQLRCHAVIPFLGSTDELQSTLAPLRSAGLASITVVDDGSDPPIPLIDHITVLRHDQPAGPAAARNTGWRHVVETATDAQAIVFIDGGVVTDTVSWLQQLSGHLADPEVAAVAPRVASTPGTAVIEQYEALFSPLDLGPDPSVVGPGQRVTYVPSACLLVKAEALVEADGFDESLRYGEDVDLIWRLSEQSQVRYDPSVVVHHGPRETLRSFAAQRFNYATAAAALDERHPSASAPWKSSLVGVAGVMLVTIGRPVSGVLVGFAPVTLLARQLERTATPTATSIRLLAAGHRWALRSFAESAGRSWSSIGAIAVFAPSMRLASISWMVAGWMRRLGSTQSPGLLALGIVDDAAYGAGAMTGAIRHRSLRSLLPSISRWG